MSSEPWTVSRSVGTLLAVKLTRLEMQTTGDGRSANLLSSYAVVTALKHPTPRKTSFLAALISRLWESPWK